MWNRAPASLCAVALITTVPGSREGLEPRRDVQGLPEGGRVGTVSPHDHQPDVDPHAGGEAHSVLRFDVGVQLVEAGEDGEAGVHRQRGVVLVRDRRAEPGGHAVAGVAADAPTEAR